MAFPVDDYEIRWKNFRGFVDTGWIKIRPLTILIGPNNSGKTSILAPLMLMSQTMMSRDRSTSLVTRGPQINLGNYKDIIHNHDLKKPLFFGLRYHLHTPSKKKKEKPLGTYPPGALEVILTSKPKHPEDIVLSEFRLFDIYTRHFLTKKRNRDSTYSVKSDGFKITNKKELDAISKSKPVNFLFSPTSAIRAFDAAKDEKLRSKNASKEFNRYLGALAFSFEELFQLFSLITYIGPLREKLKRYYDVASERPYSVGSRGEHMANLVRRAFPNGHKAVNKWVNRFGFGRCLKAEDSLNRFTDTFSLYFEPHANRQMKVNVAEAGFGASQVLPLIVQAISARKHSLTIAEQPEIHLNPKLQSELADLFADMANNDRRVIVETHSEHLLLRLRRLIASGILSNEKVAVYYVDKINDESRIKEIKIDENGRIPAEIWPKGFFAENLTESLALANEQSKTIKIKPNK